jgi:hypothetical protein
VVAINARNFVAVGLMAAVFIIALKTALRFVPTPAFVREKVGEI